MDGNTIASFDLPGQSLGGQSDVRLWINGTDIASSGKDGPYFVKDMVIRKSDDTVIESIADVHQTQSYAAADFEGNSSGDGNYSIYLPLVIK